MNRSASIRHNAKILLGHVRGKNKAERKQIYAMVAGGPLGLIAHVASMIVATQRRVENERDSFEAAYERVSRDVDTRAGRATRQFRL